MISKMRLTIKNFVLVCSAVLALGVFGCASHGEGQGAGSVHDPLEGVNRVTMEINEAVDEAIIEPIATGYRKFTPSAFRIALNNFLNNLKSPIIIGNEILQGDLKGAGNATARMIINTLAGFGGILDLADQGGIERESEDFGQTLAKWGIGDGMYLVLPILGPSSLRDTAGLLIDGYLDPLRIYLFNIEKEGLYYARIGASALSERERLLDVINDLRKNSFDYYAALRSSYFQHRGAMIRDENSELSGGPEIPDYDDF